MAEDLHLYLVRHGEVHNPLGIIYGRLPGYGLSEEGAAQLRATAAALGELPPLDRLCASPLQRAQESAAILAAALGLPVTTDERLVETEVSGYEGRTFDSLPRPYITEGPVHEGLECAASIRRRLLDWTGEMARSGVRRLAAVSHRDPIGVLLLHWTGRGLEDLPGLQVPPGGAYEVVLAGSAAPRVRQLAR